MQAIQDKDFMFISFCIAESQQFEKQRFAVQIAQDILTWTPLWPAQLKGNGIFMYKYYM